MFTVRTDRNAVSHKGVESVSSEEYFGEIVSSPQCIIYFILCLLGGDEKSVVSLHMGLGRGLKLVPTRFWLVKKINKTIQHSVSLLQLDSNKFCN